MAIWKLAPAFQSYLWGGHKLVEEYHKNFDGPILAESWELSCHPAGPSRIVGGTYDGKTLEEAIEAEGKNVLGTDCARFPFFPVLIKLIDAKDNLSIQVHPDDSYALSKEGQFGKTEVWYILEAEEGASLYFGFDREITKEEFQKRIENDDLLPVLRSVPVKKGDVFFIEAGTLHAVGKGILLAEIQQNSNLTYRVYDYGRIGKDGKRRELHIEKALEVTNLCPIDRQKDSTPHIAACEYFTVDKVELNGEIRKTYEGTVTEKSFLSILILSGEGILENQDQTTKYQKGDSFFLPANSGTYRLTGTGEMLLTTV